MKISWLNSGFWKDQAEKSNLVIAFSEVYIGLGMTRPENGWHLCYTKYKYNFCFHLFLISGKIYSILHYHDEAQESSAEEQLAKE